MPRRAVKGEGMSVRRPNYNAQPHRSPGAFSSPALTGRQVSFEFYDPKATSVSVVGSFNNWDAQASPLRNLGAGGWCVQVLLPPGRYEYRFLVDGQRRMDPTARHRVTDCCGSVSSVLVVQ